MQGPSTRSLHADRALSDLPDVAPAIRPSTTFEDGTLRRYRRASHETTERLEAVLGSLEGGHAVAYSSGMAAVAAVLEHVEPSRVVLPDVVYHEVRELVRDRERRGILVRGSMSRLAAGDLVWVETPSNPFCEVTDIAAVSKAAHAVGAFVAVDATLATPANLRPLDFGADIVVHATTKAISGHSDAMGGVVVVGDTATAESLVRHRTRMGSIPGSLDVWLTLRGVRTLPLRAERAAENASALAAAFSEAGVRTWYPGLDEHPGHDVAVSQMRTMGSMLSIDLGSGEAAAAFVDEVEVFTSATSLGGVESLVEVRSRSDASIAPGVVRISVGIEDAADLVDDALSAYEASQRS